MPKRVDSAHYDSTDLLSAREKLVLLKRSIENNKQKRQVIEVASLKQPVEVTDLCSSDI